VVADRKPGRLIHYAILASLALHAGALLVFPDLIDSARQAVGLPRPLVARLLEPEPPAPVPVPAPPPMKPEPPLARQAPVERKPPPRVVKPAPVAPQPLPAPSFEAQPEPAPVAPPVAAVKPQPAPSSVAPAAAPPGVEPPEKVSRDQYRLQLIGEARRHKRYPPLARENNWQGDVLVAVSVGANGRASVNVKASSGYEVLDRQALDMFGQAARAVPVPPALRGKPFALEVRAVYGLED
jgi:periplasmic protein TonB